MPNYNGQKRSLTLQVIKYENGVEVGTTTYNGLLAFTYDSINYPLITNTQLQSLSDVVYEERLYAFLGTVSTAENMDAVNSIFEGFEPIIEDGTSCPIPDNWRNITTSANVDLFGTTTGGGTFLIDTTCTVIATPSSGYKFDHWLYTLNGVAQPNVTSSTYQFIVSEDAHFEAVFSVSIVTTYSVVFSNHVCQIVP